jgi:hypothetical protein
MSDKRPPRAGGDAAAIAGVQKTLEKLTPRSLDDIVRRNRDRCRIGLATPDELTVRAAKIPPQRTRQTISEWRMIAIRAIGLEPDVEIDGFLGNSCVALLGQVADLQRLWITSAVLRIDADAGLVRTRNSLYRVSGAAAAGEPDEAALIFLCATLHRWGVGAFLGAPAFFY